MKGMLLALVAVLLAGCATRQVSPNAAVAAPHGQVLAMQSPVPGGGDVTVVRDAGGSPCLMGLFVDGALVAKLGKSQKVTIYLPQGRAVLSAHLVGKGLCGLELNERGVRAAQVMIESGDTQFFRIAADGQGTTAVTPLID